MENSWRIFSLAMISPIILLRMTRVNAVKNSIFLIKFLIEQPRRADSQSERIRLLKGFLPLKMEKMTKLDTNAYTEFQNQLVVRMGYE